MVDNARHPLDPLTAAEIAAADRPLEDTDVAIWYTLGAHHVPRPEDWPVMPVQQVGFRLQPVGFFDRNPALDVPPPMADPCSSHGAL